jgi:pantothenate kinase-related protein Tda10
MRSSSWLQCLQLYLNCLYTYCRRLRLATRPLWAGSEKDDRRQLATTGRPGTHDWVFGTAVIVVFLCLCKSVICILKVKQD